MYDLGLINGKTYRNGHFTPLDVYITKEKIAEIVSPDKKLSCNKTVDCSGKLVMPGFIDPHVHINLDLGEFKTADDYESASEAAAFGGITTFIDFLEPVNTEAECSKVLQQKHKEAEKSYIDYSFHTTVGNFSGDVDRLAEKSLANGIPTIKLFTTYSESNRRCSYKKIKEFIANTKITNTLIMIHAENDEHILNANISDTLDFYEHSRPATAEIEEIERLAQFVSETGGRIYFVHVTCGSSIELLKTRFGNLLQNNIFIESCPQYFYLTKEKFTEENGNLYLLAPPLRSIEEQEKLKNNIDSISTIGTDHAPFMREEKLRYKEVSKVPKGLGSLEYSFSLMYNLFGEQIIPKFTINPAIIHSLFPRKGIIKEGSDADLVIFNPEKEFIVDSGHSKSDYSPYGGRKLVGAVESTILRGEFIVKKRKLVGRMKGQFISRVN